MYAQNLYNGKINCAKNHLTNSYDEISKIAANYKQRDIPWIVIAEESYGEGSSRDHAALETRYLNGKAVVAKSFSKLHELNLKKQGVLPLTFQSHSDYKKICEKDQISIDISKIEPKKTLKVFVAHANNEIETIYVTHTLTEEHIEWFEAGSSLGALFNN